MKLLTICFVVLAAVMAASAQRSPTWEQMIAQHENERSALYNRQDSEFQLTIKMQENSLAKLEREDLKSALNEKYIEERQKLSERHAKERAELAKLHHAERVQFGKPAERSDDPAPRSVGKISFAPLRELLLPSSSFTI